MPSLSELLNQAYIYTKNHKILWFYGFFLTSWSGLSFIRRVDLNEGKLLLHLHRIEHFIGLHPVQSILSAAGSFLTLLLAFFIGAVARAVIISYASDLESGERSTLQQTIKKTSKHCFKVFRLGIVVNFVMFVILIFLLSPLYISFSRGQINETIVLGIAALAIYLPIVIIISLVNIFASCYIVLYGFGTMKAVRAAFDLMANFFDKIAAVFIVLATIYGTSFIFSFLLMGTVSGLKFFLGSNLHTLAISSFFVIIVAALIVLGILMLFINAVLNVFTNITWTLFFINIVKAERLEKGREALVDMGG